MARKKVTLQQGSQRGRGRPREKCYQCGADLLPLYFRSEQQTLREKKESVELLGKDDPMLGGLVRINGLLEKEAGELPEGSRLSIPTGRFSRAYKFAVFGRICVRCGYIVQVPNEQDEIEAELESKPLPMPVIYSRPADVLNEGYLDVNLGKKPNASSGDESIFTADELELLFAEHEKREKRK